MKQVKAGDSTRSYNELYKLVLEEFVSGSLIHPDHFFDQYQGICSVINNLYYDSFITHREMYHLKRHFLSQKPSSQLHKEFFIHPNFSQVSQYWWGRYDTQGDLSRLQRIDFLNKMIEITKDI